MSTPSTDDTPTLDQQVNELANQLVTDDKGTIALPDGVEASDIMLYAAKTEKRRRDTQGSFTKGQQRIKALEVENTKLADGWEQDSTIQLSNTEAAKLDELKVQDPDEWRKQITALEGSKKTKFKETRETITKEASQMTELEQREQELVDHNSSNPESQITDDVIENDIPPRITNKLKNGEISFKEFLDQCGAYLVKPKKVGKTGAPGEPNLGDSRGGHQPTPEAIQAQSSTDYKEEIF